MYYNYFDPFIVLFWSLYLAPLPCYPNFRPRIVFRIENHLQCDSSSGLFSLSAVIEIETAASLLGFGFSACRVKKGTQRNIQHLILVTNV